MTQIAIRDLVESKELDKQAMAGTKGGFFLIPPGWYHRRPRYRDLNNVNFGTGNSFVGNTAGVNNGSQTINGGIHF